MIVIEIKKSKADDELQVAHVLAEVPPRPIKNERVKFKCLLLIIAILQIVI